MKFVYMHTCIYALNVCYECIYLLLTSIGYEYVCQALVIASGIGRVAMELDRASRASLEIAATETLSKS